MQRTQALESASEIIFLESTASCYESHATITVVLTPTPVRALPIAVLMHNCQTTESYKTAFGLLRQKYPLCFGGLQCSAKLIAWVFQLLRKRYALPEIATDFCAVDQHLNALCDTEVTNIFCRFSGDVCVISRRFRGCH
nr:uncharacterized protein LOC119168135 [Rhipicephalus microplus]